MTEYLTEQEQIELLKNWIKQYSFVILAGFMIAVLAITGWRYWQQRQNNRLDHASSVYDEMLTVRAQNDAAATVIQSHKLYSHYKNTIYGEMAALMQARNAISKNDYSQATDKLNWVIKKSSAPSFKQIARIRLARLFIAEQKPQQAIEALATVNDNFFAGLINEVRGDAYVAMNDFQKAHDAYGTALKELPNAESIRPLLQMKYDNLATDVSKTS